MDNLLVILRRPPYGVVNAAEAIRHAGGAKTFDYGPKLFLIDSGVCLAKKGQNTGDSGFTNLGENLDLLSGEMEIYADEESLKEYRINPEDLVEGVKVVNEEALRQALREAQSVMIF